MILLHTNNIWPYLLLFLFNCFIIVRFHLIFVIYEKGFIERITDNNFGCSWSTSVILAYILCGLSCFGIAIEVIIYIYKHNSFIILYIYIHKYNYTNVIIQVQYE